MKTEMVKICAILAGLVVFATMQDMSGTVFGAKPPFLLAFGCFAGVPAAVGAGLFADALGGMPFGCSSVFFSIAALATRAAQAQTTRIAACLMVSGAAAIYQMWISTWGGDGGIVGIISIFFMSAILAPLMSLLLASVRKRIGIDNFSGGKPG